MLFFFFYIKLSRKQVNFMKEGTSFTTNKLLTMCKKKYEILTKEEERNLLIKAKRGDKNARESLLMHNLLLIGQFARDYEPMGVSFDDLFMEGIEGFYMGLDHYDLENTCKLNSYVGFYVRKKIRNYVVKNKIGGSYSLKDHNWYQKYLKVKREFFKKEKRIPSREELAQLLQCSCKKVLEMECAFYDECSLNEKYKGDDIHEIGDLFPDQNPSIEEKMEGFDLEERIHALLKDKILTDKEKTILQMRYGFNGDKCYTYKEIGEYFGFSKQCAAQMHDRALHKIQSSYYMTQLSDYSEAKQKVYVK